MNESQNTRELPPEAREFLDRPWQPGTTMFPSTSKQWHYVLTGHVLRFGCCRDAALELEEGEE